MVSQKKKFTPSAPDGAQTETGSSGSSDAHDECCIDVSLLLKDNKVLALEAGSDFIDMFARVLQQPLGAVAGYADGATSKTAFPKLQKSLAGLREPLFVEGRKSKQREIAKSMDAASCFSGHEDSPETPEITAVSGNKGEVTPLGRNSFNIYPSQCGSWYGHAFRPVGDVGPTTSFEVHWTHQSGQNYMVGVMDDSQDTLKMTLSEVNAHATYGVHVFFYNGKIHQVYDPIQSGFNPTNVQLLKNKFPNLTSGKEYKFRCSKKGDTWKLEFGMSGTSVWTPVGSISCKKAAKLVPVVNTAQQSVNPWRFSFELDSKDTGPAKIFHPVARFLVGNDLEICESSSLKALEIMQKYDVEKPRDLKVFSATFGQTELRRLLGRALCGETDVLDYAMKGPDGKLRACGKDESLDASCANSVSSEFSGEIVETTANEEL